MRQNTALCGNGLSLMSMVESSRSAFKRLVRQSRKTKGLFGKVLRMVVGECKPKSRKTMSFAYQL